MKSKGLSRIAYNSELVKVGECAHRDEFGVTDTPQEITITSGKNTIEIINIGTKIVYYGGQGVTNAKGFPLYRRASKIWNNIKINWSIYVVCASTETSKLRIVEYD